MIEREEQLHALAGIVDSCRLGRSRVAVVSGAAGSGKTALLEEFLKSTASDVLLLPATASHAERDRPLGVFEQLVREVCPPCTEQPGPTAGAEDVEAFCTGVQRRAQGRPVVVIVDDVHLADGPSQHALAMIERRFRHTAFALVVAELAGTECPASGLRAELARHPGCVRLRLGPLSVDGVVQLYRTVGVDLPPGAAASVHTVTGGSPRLCSALLADRPRDAAALRVGRLDTFLQNVFCCLRTLGPEFLATAQSAAIFDVPEMAGEALDRAEVVARHSGREVDAVRWLLDMLEEAGVVRDGAFRHPAARSALVRSIRPAPLAEQRARAAEVLLDLGAGQHVIAALLCELDSVPTGWGRRVLRESAEADLRAHRYDSAVRKLMICARSSADEAERAETTLLVLEIEWRRNPAAAARHVPELIRASEQGWLQPESMGTLASLLAWYGRLDELGGALPPAVEAARRRSVPWLHVFAPVAEGGVAGRSPSSVPRTSAGRRMVGSLTGDGSPAEATAAAHAVLQDVSLQESTFDEIMAAFAVMLANDEVEPVARCCDQLLEAELIREAPTWEALVRSLRADVALRQGDLTTAASSAAAALEMLPAGGWGVAAAGPVATVVLSASAMGEHDVAAGHLRLPLPDSTFDTIFGSIHLDAHGWHYLALGQPESALRCFQQAGSLVQARGADRPGILPWRCGALRAHLALGHEEAAARLAAEGAELAEGNGPRTRGMVLRDVAATLPVPQRFTVLDEAVELLTRSGDRLSLARTLLDLSQAHRLAGNARECRDAARKGTSLARWCGAASLYPGKEVVVRSGTAPMTVTPGSRRRALSGAEHRVAALAAQGCSNKDISFRLHITVSTVEQHLTQVYRKLEVSRRSDLARVTL